MMKPKTVAWFLLVAGILFLAAAILPLRRGEPINIALLLLAGGAIVLAPIVGKKAGSQDSNPPAA